MWKDSTGSCKLYIKSPAWFLQRLIFFWIQWQLKLFPYSLRLARWKGKGSTFIFQNFLNSVFLLLLMSVANIKKVLLLMVNSLYKWAMFMFLEHKWTVSTKQSLNLSPDTFSCGYLLPCPFWYPYCKLYSWSLASYYMVI